MGDKYFDMTGETVLITGGGTGLGRQFAMALSGAGATVILSGRRLEKLEESAELVTRWGGVAHCVTMDVSDPESVAAAVAACNDIAPVSVLINNAGTSSTTMLMDLSEDDWDSVIDTNLKGAWLVAREVVAGMIARQSGGAIVNIASVLAGSVQKGTGAYGPSKAGLVHLTRQMALEWARYQVRCNALAPGYFLSDISSYYLETDVGKAMVRRIPMRRLGDPPELDAALLLLASSASRYMTGSVVSVDGGLSLSVV
jgi:NAD(P)-dependent dehydrogenase (short-subunit alcohol dehydrogenase family)